MRFVRNNGRKNTFEWPKVVSEVDFPAFWGVIRSIKVVSVFRFGDRKCRFRDSDFRAFLGNVTYKTRDNFLGPKCLILNPPFLEFSEQTVGIP